jgi:hypothetical protein
MSKVFKELGNKFLKMFVDELNVHSESWEEHLQHLDVVFLKLKEVNLKLNSSKCYFATKCITFLGHLVSNEGTKLNPGKTNAMLHFLKPRMVINVKSFLILTWYYQNYVQGYSQLVVPLFELIKKDIDFVWNLSCQQAFEAVKVALVDAPVFIQLDFEKLFCFNVD